VFLGIDIGSSSSKAAILNEQGELVCTEIVNRGTGTTGVDEVLEKVFAKANITKDDIRYTVVTGYGRVTYTEADEQITEISCHAKGTKYLVNDVTAIIDIGGQDAKAIKVSKSGRVTNFVMNEKCAAGTGRFLEVLARVLDCKIGDLSDLADQSENVIPISSVCVVFAESEVISRLSSGAAASDIARGVNVSIAKRVAGMSGRIGIGPEDHVVMTGGVALNSNMVEAMGEELGCEIRSAPNSQAVGAIGAAVFAYEAAQED